MAFKIVLLFAFVAAASAQYHQEQNSHGAIHQQQAQGVSYGHQNGGHQEEEKYGPAKYDFSYEVHDEKTGDIKHQKESREGDHVVGEYSFIEADGHRRTVKYSSDKHTGFVADVHREEIPGYQAPVYHQQAAHGHEQSIHKVVAAPVHYVSSGNQGSHSQGQAHSNYHY